MMAFFYGEISQYIAVCPQKIKKNTLNNIREQKSVVINKMHKYIEELKNIGG
jgi:hypothetical protein